MDPISTDTANTSHEALRSDAGSNAGQVLHARWMLTAEGWQQHMALHVDASGLITEASPAASASDRAISLDVVVPGMINAHSHAFQHGLLGRTQRFLRPEDDFWSWRSVMYEAAGNLTPASQEAIAFQAFSEMVASGYTTVCEFHYTHGATRRDHGELPVLMSEAVLRAAERAGIRIRLLPVCYQRAGFGRSSLLPEQRSFGLDTDVYLGVIEHLRTESHLSPLQTIGYAPHSLRAVDLDTLQAISDHRNDTAPEAPIHIHVAEQAREVNECMLSTGKRPVEWLLDAMNPDSSWCLIHATHMTDGERRSIARSKATVCLCPTTEGDLGDGFFPLADFVSESGAWAIGSDSNVCVHPAEELRMLDWQQRLHQRKRNAFRFDGSLAASTRLYQMALNGGRAASMLPVGRLEAGCAADLVELDSASMTQEGLSPDEILSAWVYSGSQSLLKRVMTAGKTRFERA